MALGKARIYFTPGDRFEIVDRDATDGRAEIIIPTVLQNNPIADSALCEACEDLTGKAKADCEERYCEDQAVIEQWTYMSEPRGSPVLVWP